MSKPLPDITPREANIRRAAHLFTCFGSSERAGEICYSEGISPEERELGWQRFEDQERERRLQARICGSPEYGNYSYLADKDRV